VRIDCLLRARAHVSELAHERDQLRAELAQAHAALNSQQRALRTIESAGETLRSLLDRQHGKLESAPKRWAGNPETRDDLQRFTQIAAEIAESIELLQGSATRTVLRVQESEASAESSDGCASAVK
jgi:predicted nuclease with TOPRIM domain